MTKIEHELNFGVISKKYAPKKVKSKSRKVSVGEYYLHIFSILVYFTVLSAQFIRLVFHISLDPDPKIYPYDRHDVCNRDSHLTFTMTRCIYYHRPNDYKLDLYLLVFCVIFFLYAQFIIRKTDKKSLRVASILIRISLLCCMRTIAFVYINAGLIISFFIILPIKIFIAKVGILPITVLLIFFLNKWRLRRKTTF
jgi:hypothetical protein